MHQHLEQLKAIIYSGDYDDESRARVEQLEQQLEKAIANEKLLAIPAVQEYAAFLEREIERCKELLSENTELTDRQRIQLHERKAACRDFLTYFRPTRRVEQSIKQALHAAQTL